MAAGLGFKTFQTGEVLTAADTNGYLMQGVLVFASAAARDAAITSPQEGQFAYLKDTNVTTYYTGSAWANLDTTGMTNPMTTTGDTIYSSSGSTPARLGIGTAGQVLTVNSGATAPEWATPAAGGGAYTLINTGGTTLSGATTTISSIPATYTDLYILAINFRPATDNTDLVFYVNGDSAAKYVRAGAGNDSGTGSFGDTNVNLATGQDNGTGNGQASVMIRGYTLSTWKMFFANSITNDSATATNARWATNIGATNITAAIDSITFLCASGNFTSGTVYVYGVK